MKHSILLVEDEANILKVLSTALKKDQFNVETTTTGEAALGSAARRPRRSSG